MGQPIALDLPAAIALIPHSDGDPAAIRELIMAAAGGINKSLIEREDGDET